MTIFHKESMFLSCSYLLIYLLLSVVSHISFKQKMYMQLPSSMLMFELKLYFIYSM